VDITVVSGLAIKYCRYVIGFSLEMQRYQSTFKLVLGPGVLLKRGSLKHVLAHVPGPGVPLKRGSLKHVLAHVPGVAKKFRLPFGGSPMLTVVLGTEMVGSKIPESRMAVLEGPKEFRLPASAVTKLKGITLGPGVLELLLTWMDRSREMLKSASLLA